MLTPNQLVAISVIERTCSILSALGSLFIITTFCSSTSFHRPINRLVFYASFGNILVNIGTLISRAYIDDEDSAGCQFQAAIIQMFMPADVFWTLAMAINVYLTFYLKFDASKLRRMEPYYLAVCYGIPLIPAITYIFVRDHGTRVYGDANLWCWVTSEWDVLRIATFYAPVWVAIIITFSIYIRAGRTIYNKRRELLYISASEPDPLTTMNGDAGLTVGTTEVVVTSEAADETRQIPLQPLGQRAPEDAANHPNTAYSVTISSNPKSHNSIVPKPHSETRPVQVQRPYMSARRRNYELNTAAWSYTKCAILFFTAMLITWIPSSANRVYSAVHGGRTLAPLEFMSAFVLPLQGFWNASIYIVTSWAACRNLLVDLRLGKRPAVTEIVGGMRSHEDSRRRSASRNRKTYESESTTELAHSRADPGEARTSL
ncbi:G-protein coupled receptor [Stachybotrys elegans]|uniref:G-protein coupled receptor n=1 Tax=Stachybotrys elegans TaxID=80388 RepID=A0A8K0SM69_9HYPO|nr:G-protein coupled receptor [Stachybotrys elegans]